MPASGRGLHRLLFLRHAPGQLFDIVYFGATGSGRRRDLGVGRRGRFARDDRLDLDQAAAAVDQAELVGGGIGEVDDPVGMEWAAVGDAYHYRLAALDAGDAHVGGQGQRGMRGGHREHVVGLADRGLLAVELLAVPTGDAACLVRLDGRIRDVFLAEHNIGFGRRFVQRFPFRFGIRDIVEAIRDVVGGAVILVEAAAALEDGRRLLGWGRGFGRRAFRAIGAGLAYRRWPAAGGQQQGQGQGGAGVSFLDQHAMGVDRHQDADTQEQRDQRRAAIAHKR